MSRILNAAGVAIAVAAAGAVYHMKLEAGRAVDKVAALQREIQRERDAIALFKAEWAQLNQPGRVQSLANRHLELKPLDPRQIVRGAEVPEREPHEPRDGEAKPSAAAPAPGAPAARQASVR